MKRLTIYVFALALTLVGCSTKHWQHTQSSAFSDDPRIQKIWLRDTHSCELERSTFLAGHMPGAQNVFDRAVVQAGGNVTWSDCMKLRGWREVDAP